MILLTTMLGMLGHSDAVRACQVGYLPDETKFAMLAAEPSGPVAVRRAKDGKALLTVATGPARRTACTTFWGRTPSTRAT